MPRSPRVYAFPLDPNDLLQGQEGRSITPNPSLRKTNYAIGVVESAHVSYLHLELRMKSLQTDAGSPQTPPRIAITMGDVNGIGPEILAHVLGDREWLDTCRPTVYGCRQTFEAACKLLRVSAPPHVAVRDCGHPIERLAPGTLRQDAGAAAVTWIREAVAAAMNGEFDAIVTCPINKEGVRLAGCSAIGHTEIVAEMTGTPEYRMSLFADRMRIVHITGHLPLVEALTKVRTPRIAKTIRIADDALDRLALARRRIAVAGLNPHAGENGMLGHEEQMEIAPAVAMCAGEGIDCSGPYPPDSVFRRMRDGEFDLVVAMYHDQGHIPLKLIAMDEGVNVTLGIPIIRTSVDHGTAYDIAWKGVARAHSLFAAIALAARFAAKRPAGIPA